MRFLYTLGISSLYQFLKIVSYFNPKLKLWVKAQKQIQYRKSVLSNNVVWFHVASYGEFEQAEPVIAQYKINNPNSYILLSFFSPSGKEKHNNYKNANEVIYLPIDTPANVNAFLNHYQPTLAVFVKYEYWFNFLHQLYLRNIPTVYFSCLFTPNQFYFKPYAKWFLKHLQRVNVFLVQNDASLQLAKKHKLNAILSGDTRVDKVILNAKEEKDFSLIKDFCARKPTIILGSMWEYDWEIWKKAIAHLNNYQIIIAPHEVDELNIKKFDKINWMYYSKIKTLKDNSFLMIDCIGVLKYIYKYGTVVYIGGGFGRGIHNILEASVFGKGVIFGPNYLKSLEAHELIKFKCAFSIQNSNELLSKVNFINQNQLQIKSQLQTYFSENHGATQKVVYEIENIKKIERNI
jgi:3-deoxy-D-manno-octulosonic-acid transferase